MKPFASLMAAMKAGATSPETARRTRGASPAFLRVVLSVVVFVTVTIGLVGASAAGGTQVSPIVTGFAALVASLVLGHRMVPRHASTAGR